MPDTRALRWSAWTLFVMALAHLLGHILTLRTFASPQDPKDAALVQAMSAYVLPGVPAGRSFLDLYVGFSVFYSAACATIAGIVLMAVSGLKNDAAALRRLARIYLAGLLALTIISVRYFPMPPTIFQLVAFGLGAFGLARLRKAA